MASLKALRKRIATVRSTQQITRAMKLVSAAKLRRAQEAAERARPYAAKLAELFAAVTAEVDAAAHPLLARRDERRIDVVVITSDRGLCGGYNANLLRRAEALLRERPQAEVALAVVGRKGIEYFRRRGRPLLAEHTGILATPPRELTARFAAAETDAVYLVYSRFRSAIAQIPTVVPLLPVPLPPREGPAVEYLFEPARPALLALLLPRYIETLVTQALLEAVASEHGARMTAM